MLQKFVKTNAMNNYYHNQITNTTWNIDFSFRCRLECPLCMRQLPGGKEKIKRSKDMTLDQFAKVMRLAPHVSLCGQLSDPIYNPILPQAIELKQQYPNKRLEIHTNGTGKSEQWWSNAYNLSDNSTHWIFGLDGFDQETANIYRVNTNYDEVIKAMLLGRKLNKKVAWQFIVFEHNEHQVEAAIEFAKNNDVKFILIKSSRWHKNSHIKKPSEQYISNDETKHLIYTQS